jgi:large subunit ribosomal protein L18
LSVNKREARKRRHIRARKKIFGTKEMPRLNVFRSAKHIYAQIIDDFSGSTLTCASSLDKELKEKINDGGNIDAAKIVGTLIAKRAVGKGIKRVVFDRGGFFYHGRIKALADSVREGGLEF